MVWRLGLVSDAIASLTAANAELCLAATGTIGLVDFGGSGTSATLVDIAGDFEPVTPTLRYPDFSGDEIDAAILLRVFEELGHGSGIDPASTAAVGQLAQLREQCRAAKEQLSTDKVAEFTAELGGRRSNMRLTRDELGDLIQDRLTGFIFAFDKMLVRHRKSWTDLAAVVIVGGGASIPLIAERLSVHTRRPVVSPSQPACAAAAGALLLASRGEETDLRTRTSVGLLTSSATAGEVVDLGAGDVLVIDHDALTDRELAWSQTEYPGDIRVPYTPDDYDEDGHAGWSMRLNLIDEPLPVGRPWRRLRFSQLIVGLCALVAMTAIGGVAYTLASIENREAPPAPTVVPVPAPPVSSLLPSSRASAAQRGGTAAQPGTRSQRASAPAAAAASAAATPGGDRRAAAGRHASASAPAADDSAAVAGHDDTYDDAPAAPAAAHDDASAAAHHDDRRCR